MCVIIHRNPGVKIPEEKLASACSINKAGFGLSILDRGKLEAIHSYDDRGNDPAIVIQKLEEAKDKELMLHLRLATAGEKALFNCHPFISMKRDTDGLDVHFMHNGTLSDFKDPDDVYSDSYMFNQRVVIPTLKRFSKSIAPEELLKDELLSVLLHQFSTGSVFTLIDNFGNVLKINKKHGKDFEGWWASNNSYFDRKSHIWDGTNWEDYDKYGDYTDYMSGEATPSGIITPKKKGATTTPKITAISANQVKPRVSVLMPDEDELELIAESVDLKEGMANMSSVEKPNRVLVQQLLSPNRKTFCELAGLSSLSEITALEQEDFEEILNFFPMNAVNLIMDLVYELYLRDKRANVVVTSKAGG